MYITVDETTLRPGDEVEVTIDNVTDECLDQGEPRSTAPSRVYKLSFEQDGRIDELATFTEATGPSVNVTVVVPSDAKPGKGTLTVSSGDDADVTIVD